MVQKNLKTHNETPMSGIRDYAHRESLVSV